MENISHEVMANFRRRNKTVKDWSKEHKFSIATVRKVIYRETAVNGRRGFPSVVGERIRRTLINDGYWPEGDGSTEKSVCHSHNA